MKTLVPYYLWSQGPALLCWTGQKLIIDFCRGKTWLQEWFHAHNSLSFWRGSIIGKIKLLQGGLAERSPGAERPQGWWRHPCAISPSQSTVKIPGEDGPAELNIWKCRGQNAALGRAQGRLLLLLKKPPEAFMHQCHFSLPWGGSFSLSFPGFSVSWPEALDSQAVRNSAVPFCPSLTQSSAIPAQSTASQGLLFLAYGHCWSTLLKNGSFDLSFFFNFPFDRALFYFAAGRSTGY